MRAVLYEAFGAAPAVREVPDPMTSADGAVIRVKATGLCRSDWHGWQGHDPDIALPHVPGHELAGVVESVGAGVRRWRVGDRVTVPFVCACGGCEQCGSGNEQVCDFQEQPGFTHWGSFAELVALRNADVNLVALPDDMDFVTAAALGCRFATAWRAVVLQGRVRPDEWVAVHGCGGVGLSAVMIAADAGAQVVAIDAQPAALARAHSFGAAYTVSTSEDVVDSVRAITGGGAHLSIDAIGSPSVAEASVSGLRKRGRHVQVGLLPAGLGSPTLPMSRVIGWELEILGCHGLQAHEYPRMLDRVDSGGIPIDRLAERRISLDEAPEFLMAMGRPEQTGVTVIEPRER
ncbi:MAG: zinc-dependent alcohol dehydrogenase family protein [Candidatus Nanopelagicales bacterium]